MTAGQNANDVQYTYQTFFLHIVDSTTFATEVAQLPTNVQSQYTAGFFSANTATFWVGTDQTFDVESALPVPGATYSLLADAQTDSRITVSGDSINYVDAQGTVQLLQINPATGVITGSATHDATHDMVTMGSNGVDSPYVFDIKVTEGGVTYTEKFTLYVEEVQPVS